MELLTLSIWKAPTYPTPLSWRLVVSPIRLATSSRRSDDQVGVESYARGRNLEAASMRRLKQNAGTARSINSGGYIRDVPTSD